MFDPLKSFHAERVSCIKKDLVYASSGELENENC